MVSRVMVSKLRRDIRVQRWQFIAVATVIALGVLVFVGASDSYRNLQDSFDRAYSQLRLPDVVLSGTRAPQLTAQAASLPGRPAVTLRHQAETGLRVKNDSPQGRLIGIPDGSQPAVSKLALQSGRLPHPGEVLAEQHLADYYGLKVGDRIKLRAPSGWKSPVISGTALNPEYFWPAPSEEEIMTTPAFFDVLFIPDQKITQEKGSLAVAQLALYAQDRSQSGALVSAAQRLAEANGLSVVARANQPSYSGLKSDVDAIGTFATLLPVLFLIAAVFGTYILLSRVVSAQRAIIGTLTANGIAPRALLRHYLAFGLVAGCVGVIPGLVGGYLFGGWFTREYTDAVGLPLHVSKVHPWILVIGAVAGLVAAGLAAWAPALAATRITPAEAMRVAPPAARSARSVLERLLPPIRRMVVRWRMVVRSIGRNRKRAVLTVAGVALAVTLVLVFAGMRDTVNNVVDRQYETIQLEDADVATIGPSEVPGVLSGVQANGGVNAAEPFSSLDATLVNGGARLASTVQGMLPNTAMHDFGTAGPPPSSGGVVIGQGLRDTLRLKTGDQVTLVLSGSGRSVTEPVVGVVDEPMSDIAYIALGHLDQVLGTSTANGVMLKLRSGADADAVQRAVTALPGVASYVQTSALAKAMHDAFKLYNTLVGVMLVFAGLMAAALLFNMMSANVAERSVELGTLRAAGMGAGMLTRLVTVENLLLVLTGIPIGLVTGTLLARYVMSTYETEGYSWELDMRGTTPVWVALGIFIAALLALTPVLRTMRRVDVAKIVRERSL